MVFYYGRGARSIPRTRSIRRFTGDGRELAEDLVKEKKAGLLDRLDGLSEKLDEWEQIKQRAD